MPLKKAAGNMYSWITHLWNPVKGFCPYNCSYCYTHRWGNQASLHLDKKEFQTNLGTGNFIFICSGCDLFHPDVPDEWIARIFSWLCQWELHTGNKNTYLWHTKNPARFIDMTTAQYYPDNSILCVTMETNRHYEQMGNAPWFMQRVYDLERWHGMITIEPIIDFDLDFFSSMIISCHPNQVNIGADSGHNHLPEPSREKVEELIELLAPHAKIHLKNNLRRILPESRYYGNA